jgi:type I restriction enzyme S subunit
MHSLFTRGLRGEPQKETEIGPVPESWGTVECEDVSDSITVGVVVKPASHYVENGIPAFRSLNIRSDRIDASTLVYFSSEDNDTLLSKSKLKAGDVLVVRTGYPGTSCVVPEEFDGANCIDHVIVRPNAARLHGEFLSRFLNSGVGRRQARSNSHGLAQKHLNVGAVRRLRMPLPPTLDEQREIVSILEAIDRKIDLHRRKRAVLDELFRALLHKLMTGEIRVSDLDLSALADSPTAGEAA